MKQRTRSRVIPWFSWLGVLTGILPVAGRAATEDALTLNPSLPAAQTTDLTALSLEDLMNIEVTSVSKHAQRISEAPAAVTVITQDDIRRSGLQSLPELMRLAPGMDVARLNAGMYAISARGFNERFGNKMLVLMDGRQLYNSIFSGVVWEAQDYLLPDLDRIEVIRGPGATLWGANAVNGVINITSKSARDTQGWLLDARGSNAENNIGVRYGDKFDDDTYYRVWGKFNKTENLLTAADDPANDAARGSHAGFRVDRYLDNNTFTIQADGFASDNDTVVNYSTPGVFDTVYAGEDVSRYAGGNLLLRWNHKHSDQSETSLQVYFDAFHARNAFFDADEDSIDLDFQNRFPLGDRQSITWGLGYRQIFTGSGDGGLVVLTPRDSADYRINAFVQDDIQIIKDRLHVIVGSKFEQNSFSGLEIQPSARFWFSPAERHSVWGAISWAARTPNRIELDGQVALTRVPPVGGQPATVIDEVGNSDLDSEELLALEAGYRVRPVDELSLDFAVFYNHYDEVVGRRPGSPQFVAANPPYVFVPVNIDNGASADSYGIEVAANWHVTKDWRLAASYSFLNMHIDRDDAGVDPSIELFEGNSPKNQFQVHSYYDITRNLELNASAYYVESLRSIDIPSYVRVDVAMTWRPKPGLELSVGVQNLLDDRHPEFSGEQNFEVTSEVPRTVYGQLTWRH